MYYGLILPLFGKLAGVFATAMVLPAVTGFINGSGAMGEGGAFLAAALILGALSVFFILAGRGAESDPSRADLCLTAILSWVGASLFAALPFWLMPEFSFISAWFEAVSYFTTTGVAALPDIQTPPVVLWRALLQWLGGFAAILTAILVLAPLGTGGMALRVQPIAPGRSAYFSRRLDQAVWLVLPPYLILTAVCFGFLALAGTPLFSALQLAFGALATGSLDGAPASVWPRAILSAFLVIGSIGIIHHRAAGKTFYFREPETRLLLLLFAAAGVLFAVTRFVQDPSLPVSLGVIGNSFRAAIALLSTSGTLSPEDYAPLAPLAFAGFILVLIGGSTLSTAGGLKVLRVLLLFKQGRREIHRLINPHGLISVRFNDTPIHLPIIRTVWALFLLTIAFIFALAPLLALSGVDFPSSLAVAVAAVSNAGPALAFIDPAAPAWGEMSQPAQFLLAAAMIAGRTEFVLLVSLFSSDYWRR